MSVKPICYAFLIGKKSGNEDINIWYLDMKDMKDTRKIILQWNARIYNWIQIWIQFKYELYNINFLNISISSLELL